MGSCQPCGVVMGHLAAALLHEALPDELLQPCGHQEVIGKG